MMFKGRESNQSPCSKFRMSVTIQVQQDFPGKAQEANSKTQLTPITTKSFRYNLSLKMNHDQCNGGEKVLLL